jgi:hypothetical protein
MAKVTTEFDIELAKWQAKIQQIKADMKSTRSAAKEVDLGGAMLGKLKGLLPALGIGATMAGIKGMMKQLDDLVDMAETLGETPETLQRVEMAAQRLASVDLNTLTKGMLRLERSIANVENEKANKALESFGLTAEKLMSLPLDQKLLELSAAFDHARQAGTGLSDLQDLLGRNGVELIPLLNASRDTIQDLFDTTAVTSNAAVYELAALNDELDRMWENVKNSSKGAVMEGIDWLGALGAGMFSFWDGGEAIDQLARNKYQRMENADSKASENVRKRQERARNIAAERSMKEQAEEEKRLEKEAKEEAVAQKDEESRQGRITGLQERIEKERISLLPPPERLSEMERIMWKIMDRAGEAFGAPLDKTIDGLLAAAEQLDTSWEGSEAFLKSVQEAQALQKEMEATQAEINKANEEEVSKTQTSAHTPGAVAGALNILFGRSANELLLDESKQQTAAVKDNTRVLTRIENLLKDPNRRAQVMGAFPEVFAP